MQLHTLKPASRSVKNSKRIGRGQGSGKGGSATRGYKGAQSRSGYKQKRGFEGGQLPLQRRIPRFGFKNPTKVIYRPVNLEQLQRLAESKELPIIDSAILIQYGLVTKNDRYKILGRGVLKTKIDVSAYAFSASARTAIEKLGGKATVINIHA